MLDMCKFMHLPGIGYFISICVNCVSVKRIVYLMYNWIC